MKGYKAFGKGMICRGKQYAENTVYEEERAEVCRAGMHFCTNPFDVLDHYPLVDANGDFSDFAEVEALEDAKTDDEKKFCTTKLKIGAKLSFAGFIRACVDFTLDKTTRHGHGSSGNAAQIGSSGNAARIKSAGRNAVVCCAGNGSMVKAKKGSWITLSEWGLVNGVSVPVCVRTERVDGERIKEDVFYRLKNGEFVEVADED